MESALENDLAAVLKGVAEMMDSATIDEAVDLLECAGWKGYAQAVREQSQQAAQRHELLAALKAVVRVADRQTAELDAARAAIAKAEGR